MIELNPFLDFSSSFSNMQGLIKWIVLFLVATAHAQTPSAPPTPIASDDSETGFAPSPANITTGTGNGGTSYPTPATLEGGYFVATHFSFDRRVVRSDNVRVCLKPDYETIVPTGVCYLATSVNPVTLTASYKYDVQHNYAPDGQFQNSTLYLMTYRDKHCSNANYTGLAGQTVFNLNECQAPINDLNKDYYNVMYSFVRGNYPPASKMPGPAATITGFLTSSACTSNYRVSAQVSFRDGACIVDPGQGSPLGNAEAASNSFRYHCDHVDCRVEYFSDHHCRHHIVPSQQANFTSFPDNLSHQRTGICQANPVPAMIGLANTVPALMHPLAKVVVPQNETFRRSLQEPTNATHAPTPSPYMELNNDSYPTIHHPTDPMPPSWLRDIIHGNFSNGNLSTAIEPIHEEPILEPIDTTAPISPTVYKSNTSSIDTSAAEPDSTDDEVAMPPFSYAKSVIYASTIKVAQTWGKSGIQNTVAVGYLTVTHYAEFLCNPSTIVKIKVLAVGLCQQVSDSQGLLSSYMDMVGNDGQVIVRHTVHYADTDCIYQTAVEEHAGGYLNTCIPTSDGGVAYAYSTGPTVPAVSTIKPDVTSPIIRVYRTQEDCITHGAATQVVSVLDDYCITIPGRGSALFSCTSDGYQITTAYYTDSGCKNLATIHATLPSDARNPFTKSSSPRCSRVPLPLQFAGTNFVYTASCTNADEPQESTATQAPQGYITTTYYNDAACNTPLYVQDEAIGICIQGIDPTGINFLSPSYRVAAYIIDARSGGDGEITSYNKLLTRKAVLYDDLTCMATSYSDDQGADTTPSVALNQCIEVSMKAAGNSDDDSVRMLATATKTPSARPTRIPTLLPTARSTVPIPKKYSITTFSPGPSIPLSINGYMVESHATARSCMNPKQGPGRVITARTTFLLGKCIPNVDTTGAIIVGGSVKYDCNEYGYAITEYADLYCQNPLGSGIYESGTPAPTGANELAPFPPQCAAVTDATTSVAQFESVSCKVTSAPAGYALNTLYASLGCTGQVAATAYVATGVCLLDFSRNRSQPGSYIISMSEVGAMTMLMRSDYKDMNCSESYLDPLYTEYVSLSDAEQNIGTGQCTQATGNKGMSQILSYLPGPVAPFPMIGYTVTGYTSYLSCMEEKMLMSSITYRQDACISTYSSYYSSQIGESYSCAGSLSSYQSASCQGSRLSTTSATGATCKNTAPSSDSALNSEAPSSSSSDNSAAYRSEFCDHVPTIERGYLSSTIFAGSRCGQAWRQEIDASGVCHKKFDDNGSSAGSVMYTVSTDGTFYVRAILTYSDDACNGLMSITEDNPMPLNVCIDSKDGNSMIATYSPGAEPPPSLISGVMTSTYSLQSICTQESSTSSITGSPVSGGPVLIMVEMSNVCMPYGGKPGPWRPQDRISGSKPTFHHGYEPWAAHDHFQGHRGRGGASPHSDASQGLHVIYGCSDGGDVPLSYPMSIYNDSSCSFLAPVSQIAAVDPSITKNPTTVAFDSCRSNVPISLPPMGPGPVIINSNSSHSSTVPDPIRYYRGPPRMDDSTDFDSQHCVKAPGTPSMMYELFAKEYIVRITYPDQVCSNGDRSKAMSEILTKVGSCYKDLLGEGRNGVLGSQKYATSTTARFNPTTQQSDTIITITLQRYVDPNCVVPASLTFDTSLTPGSTAGASSQTATGATIFSGVPSTCMQSLAGTSYSYSLITRTLNEETNAPLDIARGVAVNTFSTKDECLDTDAMPESVHVFAIDECLPVFIDGKISGSMIYSCEEADKEMIGDTDTYKDGIYSIRSFTDGECTVPADISYEANPLETTCMSMMESAVSYGLGNSTLYRNIECYPTTTPTSAPSYKPGRGPSLRPVSSPTYHPKARPTRSPANSPQSVTPTMSSGTTLNSKSSSAPVSFPPSRTPRLPPTRAPTTKKSNTINSANTAGEDVPGLSNSDLFMIMIVIIVLLVFVFGLKVYAVYTGTTVRALFIGKNPPTAAMTHVQESRSGSGDVIPTAISSGARPSEFQGMSPMHHFGSRTPGSSSSSSSSRAKTAAVIEDHHHAEPGHYHAPQQPAVKLERPSYDFGVELQDVSRL